MVLLNLFLTFLKIGLIGFGGGYAMLAMIQKELLEFGWVTSKEFSDIAAISQMTPGPIAVNAATYVGFKVGGFWGSFLATLGVSIPSFILVIVVAHFILKFKESKLVDSALKGIRPATVALIATAAIFFAVESFVNLNLPLYVNPGPFAIFVAAILFTVFLRMNAIYVVIISAILGIVFC